MTKSLRQRRAFKLFSHVCRMTLGAVFIFSGFVKSVDPWGTALKVNEYLSIYGLECLLPASMVFSIWLCGAELMMGLMLTFKVRIRLISIFAVVSMIFFTLLTFLSATWLPVEDCGCFGDALKLSPWATFFKNLALLPLSVVIWWRYRPDRIFAFSKLEIFLTCLFFSVGMGVGTYCYLHLPLIDFLPYRIGVNIHNEIERSAREKNVEEVVVVCRNRRSGRIKEFDLKDREWQNTKKWEWMDTKVATEDETDAVVVRPMISEFSLRDVEGDATQLVTSMKGRVYMLCVTNFSAIGERCERRMRGIVERAEREGAAVVCLTPEFLPEVTWRSFDGSAAVRCYNIDATVLKTMLRASNGMIVLDDGTIVAKSNCRDIPLNN